MRLILEPFDRHHTLCRVVVMILVEWRLKNGVWEAGRAGYIRSWPGLEEH